MSGPPARSAQWTRRPRLPAHRSSRLPRATKLARVSLSIGIVGLPNVGKSTLFNALTKAGALASNYPFATIEPNVGVVGVPDPRLAELAELFDSARIVPASVRSSTSPAWCRGASQGQGLGNQFLAHIRETDAICQVVGCSPTPTWPTWTATCRPSATSRRSVTELILADLQTLEKAAAPAGQGGQVRQGSGRGGGRRRRPPRSCSTTGTTLCAGASAAGSIWPSFASCTC